MYILKPPYELCVIRGRDGFIYNRLRVKESERLCGLSEGGFTRKGETSEDDNWRHMTLLDRYSVPSPVLSTSLILPVSESGDVMCLRSPVPSQSLRHTPLWAFSSLQSLFVSSPVFVCVVRPVDFGTLTPYRWVPSFVKTRSRQKSLKRSRSRVFRRDIGTCSLPRILK